MEVGTHHEAVCNERGDDIDCVLSHLGGIADDRVEFGSSARHVLAPYGEPTNSSDDVYCEVLTKRASVC